MSTFVYIYIYKNLMIFKMFLYLDTLYVYRNICGSIEKDIGDIMHRFVQPPFAFEIFLPYYIFIIQRNTHINSISEMNLI